jgi:hypothetical protein
MEHFGRDGMRERIRSIHANLVDANDHNLAEVILEMIDKFTVPCPDMNGWVASPQPPKAPSLSSLPSGDDKGGEREREGSACMSIFNWNYIARLKGDHLSLIKP